MPDATEWLVEYVDLDKRTVYEKFATVDKAIPFLHKVLGSGQRPRLYKETPIALTIDIDPKAPRKRRRKESTERAATPRAEEPTTKDAAAQEPAVSPVVGSAEPTASLSLWTCEASFPSDAACPGPAEFDPVSKGRFCGLHARSITESGRVEFHRRHGHRNAPLAPVVRLAHAG